jgi:hypothetical protein
MCGIQFIVQVLNAKLLVPTKVVDYYIQSHISSFKICCNLSSEYDGVSRVSRVSKQRDLLHI